MIAKFYKLKISPQNRFYNKAAYEAYLTDANVLFTYTYKNDIIPDQPFYLSRNTVENAKLLYNATYVTYDINGLMYGAFITEAQPLAPNGKQYRLNQVVDWWYFALFNEYDMHFHGSCERAHVNDIDQETKLPTLINTLPVAEFAISNYAKTLAANRLINFRGVYIDGKRENNFTFLYIFFNTPSKNDITMATHKEQVYQTPSGGYHTSQGFTYVFLYNKLSGFVYPLNIDQPPTSINDITNENITSMCISDLFVEPRGSYTITKSGDERYTVSFSSSKYGISSHTYNKEDGSLPKKLSFIYYDFDDIMPNLDTSLFKAVWEIEDDELLTATINPATPVIKQTTYNSYIEKSVIKQYANVYVNKSINGTAFDIFKIRFNNSTPPVSIYLTPDLSTYLVRFNGAQGGPRYYQNELAVNNPSYFKPDTVNDYWTRLNAKQTGISAKQIEIGAINSAIQNATKIVGTGAKAITSLQSGSAPDVGVIIDGVGSIAGNIAGIKQANLSYEQAGNMQEIAEKQYNDGKIRSDSQIGPYLQSAIFSEIYLLEYYAENYKPLQIDLHRYGYNTFLQIDDIYEHHQREHFNYFKAADIEVTGVPQFIADDIENMFKRGVHLWTRDIEEFENGTNYQLGLWEDTNV